MTLRYGGDLPGCLALVWFVFCAVVGLILCGAMIWLLIEGALWIARH
jgi:hypothetical protein